MDKWYALQVLTGKEADIAAMLRRNGVLAIAPAIRRLERKEKQWTCVSRCAIPGYVFVKCLMNTPLYYHLTRKPGVIQLLGQAGQRYTAIPDEQMHWIDVLHRAYGGQPDTASHVTADADGNAEVIDGPLLMLKDKLTKVDIRRRRATIAIELYDDTYEIDLAVEPLGDKHPESPVG